MQTPADRGDGQRCPTCGALVGASAEWCDQCFTSLVGNPGVTARARSDAPVRLDPAEPTAGEPQAAPASAVATTPTWPCSVCGHANPLDLDVCAVCGASFAQTMRTAEPRPTLAPHDAVVASLKCPGLAHARMGRTADGVARGVLVLVPLALSVLLFLSGVHGGFPFVMFVTFVLLAIGAYVATAIEARQMALGGQPFASPRTVLWATAALILVSIALLSFALVSGAKR